MNKNAERRFEELEEIANPVIDQLRANVIRALEDDKLWRTSNRHEQYPDRARREAYRKDMMEIIRMRLRQDPRRFFVRLQPALIGHRDTTPYMSLGVLGTPGDGQNELLDGRWTSIMRSYNLDISTRFWDKHEKDPEAFQSLFGNCTDADYQMLCEYGALAESMALKRLLETSSPQNLDKKIAGSDSFTYREWYKKGIRDQKALVRYLESLPPNFDFKANIFP